MPAEKPLRITVGKPSSAPASIFAVSLFCACVALVSTDSMVWFVWVLAGSFVALSVTVVWALVSRQRATARMDAAVTAAFERMTSAPAGKAEHPTVAEADVEGPQSAKRRLLVADVEAALRSAARRLLEEDARRSNR